MRDRTYLIPQRSFLQAAHRRGPAAWLPWLGALLCVLVTFTVFGQVARFAFVWWDDGLFIFENPYLQSLTFDHVLAFWWAPYAELYVPLTYTLWALTAAVVRGTSAHPAGAGPLAPAWFHGLNLLGHLVCVLVVWRLVRLLLDRTTPPQAPGLALRRVEWAACGGALLFAVHPLQVEAVAWVSGFKDVLCGVLSCVAIWQYLQYACSSAEAAASDTSSSEQGRRGPIGRYWLATGAFALALLAKPTAVVVPVVAWLLDVWGWPQTWRHRRWALLAWLGSPCCGGGSRVRYNPRRQAPSYHLYGHGSSLRAMQSPFTSRSSVCLSGWGPIMGGPAVLLSQGWVWLTGLGPGARRVAVVPAHPHALARGHRGALVAGLLPVLGLVPFPSRPIRPWRTAICTSLCSGQRWPWPGA